MTQEKSKQTASDSLFSTAHRTASPIVIGHRTNRDQVIERAKSWLDPPVPYSQEKLHENKYGIYRTDCSGFVSMAWGIPGAPSNKHGGLDTIGLAQVGFEVAKRRLRAGDALLCIEGTRLTRHVTLFADWADRRCSTYWAFEQCGGTGTVYRRVVYPYEKAAFRYMPFRYSLIEN
ncbi:NlpC/P60 family protein [Amycolatopsis keratiniphila]|uniref:hypothetical protein n=1 Tax=Amycolatopsis keratiniphila TaxID=129921 RepID=UPI0011773786|nr:hypothetical protein [Amycolatopsis keratiniphila]